MTIRPAFEIARVQCEHYRDPMGIEEAKPRLSWRFRGLAKNWRQAACDIRISGRPTTSDVTYHLNTTASVLVPWPGPALKSRESAVVEVRAMGEDGVATPWSSVTVEAGLQTPDCWQALPVTCEQQDIEKPRRPFRVRSRFNAPASFHSARLYITALGLYEPHLNGNRVGSEYLAPGWTSYDHHIVYRTYDVTKNIIPGQENVLGAWVGEGWYTGRLAFRGGWRNNYGKRPALIAQLVIDDEVVTFTGDGMWEWSYGEIITSELLNGEVYDTRLAGDAWCTTVSSASIDWRSTESLVLPLGSLVASQSPPVQVVKEIRPIALITTPLGRTVVDFGQNFAGIVRILGEPPSESPELVLRHAEVLEHGELGVRPLRHAAATERIFLGGASIQGYQPKFTSHGFRYVEVTGWPGLATSDLVGLVMHSAMEPIGTFNCSHPLLNRLHENVVWSTISNTISLPTDCPQRDERLGWTGDIQVFSPTMSFLFDCTGFLAGWLRDLYVDQRKLGGNVPVTIPDILDDLHNQRLAIWGDVAVLTPFDLYLASGEKQILNDQFDSAALWLSKGVIRDSSTGLWSQDSLQLSDWLAPKAPPDNAGDAPADSILVADAYLIHTTRTMAKICAVIGRESERVQYEREAARLLDSFSSEYITPNGRVMSDTQTVLALLIQFDIFPDTAHRTAAEHAQGYRDRLNKLVTSDNWKVATGFAGTPIILHALDKAGLLHHAYRMLQSRDSPSWLSPVLRGATTIWERWDSMLEDGSINPGEMTSFNHYALGSVASFMHSVVGGISPLEPGWRKILVRPQPGGTVTSSTVSFLSPYGLIVCAWWIVNDEMTVEVTVPPNSSALVVLPSLSETVGSGKWDFVAPWKPDSRFPPSGRLTAYGPIPSTNWEP